MGSTSKEKCKRPGIHHNMYRAVVYDGVPLFETVKNCKCFFSDGSVMSFHFAKSVGGKANRQIYILPLYFISLCQHTS